MLHTDIPAEQEFCSLDAVGGICVSIYLPTTPVAREASRDRILLRDLATAAINQLKEGGGRKRTWPAPMSHHRARRILDELVGLTFRHRMSSPATTSRCR